MPNDTVGFSALHNRFVHISVQLLSGAALAVHLVQSFGIFEKLLSCVFYLLCRASNGVSFRRSLTCMKITMCYSLVGNNCHFVFSTGRYRHEQPTLASQFDLALHVRPAKSFVTLSEHGLAAKSREHASSSPAHHKPSPGHEHEQIDGTRACGIRTRVTLYLLQFGERVSGLYGPCILELPVMEDRYVSIQMHLTVSIT